MIRTDRGTDKPTARAARRGRPWSKPFSLALAALLLLSVLPAGIASALGDNGTVTVHSFGEYKNTAQAAPGTSHADAAALLPASVPAFVLGEAPPYTEDVPVTWHSEPAYGGAEGTYRFTASAGEKTDAGWPVYTVIIAPAPQGATATGEREISAAPGTDIAALGLPASLPARVTPEPVKTEVQAALIWSSATYDPATPGTYLFTAAFAQAGWLYAGEMPTAFVTVRETPTEGGQPPPEGAHTLSFAFSGPLLISKARHAGFASYSAEKQRQVFTADVRVTDEAGNAVAPVSVNFGAFSIEAEPGTVCTVVYSANHPETMEIFTAQREVRLVAGEDESVVITGFAPTPYSPPGDADTHAITVQAGTAQAAQSALPLPQTLKATVAGGEADGYTVAVSAWECVQIKEYDPETGEETLRPGAYDPHMPGTYVFSPVLALEENVRLADGAVPPSVDVVLTAAPMAAAGEMGVAAIYGGSCGVGVTWTFNADSGLLTISGSGPMADYNNNPPWHDYKADNRSYHFCSEVTTIVIEEGVTHIGSFAFPQFLKLTSVSIPQSVTSIGRWAFMEARNLPEITLPDNVTSIGDNAFRDNDKLTRVNIPPNLSVITSRLFASCDILPSIVIPAGVTAIEEGAFEGCGGLTYIEFHIPEPLEDNAFNGQQQDGIFCYPNPTNSPEVKQKWIDWSEDSDNIREWDQFVLGGNDETPPILSEGTATRESAGTAEIGFVSNEPGEYYYVTTPRGVSPPLPIDTTGEGTACDAGKTTFDIPGLAASNEVDVYVVVKDAAGNASDPLKIEVGDYLTNVTVNQPATGGVIRNRDGTTPVSGPWETGSRRELVADPAPGYHFTGYVVTGDGSAMDAPLSPAATLTVGTGDTTVTATFAANVVTLHLRLDGRGYLRYGDRFQFWLSANGTDFLPANASNDSTSTETFLGVPSGTYTVYTGATPTARAATTVTLTVEDGDASATVHFYTLTVRAAPAGAGAVSPGGIFPAGARVPLTANETGGTFKRWASSSPSSGTLGSATSASTTYTLNGTATLTAYFLQTSGGGTGLVITPPAQDARKTTADQQTIDVSAKAALGEGDGDGVKISSLHWFRENVNGPVVPVADEAAFDLRAGGAGEGNSGAVTAGGFGGNTPAGSAALPADKNGRYWFLVTFTSGDVTVTKIGHTDIKNIFTPYDVLVRHTVATEASDESYQDRSLDYAPIKNTSNSSPGIPYDLDGANVIAQLPAGLDYDTIRIEGLAAYSGAAPTYAGVYDFEIANRGTDVAYAPKMDGDFLQNTACDKDPSDDTQDSRHHYTVTYRHDAALWVMIRAFRVDDAGNDLATEPGTPGKLFNGYQDFAAPLDGSGSTSVSHFNADGGAFVPRDVYMWASTPHTPENMLTYEPVGWYIAKGKVDFSADFDPFTNQTVADPTLGNVTYYAEDDWADFDPPLELAATDDPGGGTPYRPLANGEKLYLVCVGGGHTARVWEEYHLYKRDEIVGSGHTGDALGKAPTFDLLNPDNDSYSRTTAERDVPGYVAVGYRIVKAGDWERVKTLPYSNPESLASKDPALFHFSPLANPLQGMWESVTVNIPGSALKDGGAYGNRPHVVYYYAPDANGNGIPDCGEYEIALQYIGVKSDGTQTTLRTKYLHPRLSPLGPGAANATVYVGLDGNLYWTDNGVLTLLAPNGTPSGVSVSTSSLHTADFAAAGHNTVIEDTGGAKWIFSGDSQLLSVTIPKTASAALVLRFYYHYAADGSTTDISQAVTEHYEGASGAQISSYAPVQFPAMDTAPYTGAAAALPGYVAVGYVPRDFDGVAVVVGLTQAQEILAVAGFVTFYGNAGLAVTLPPGAGREVTYIYLPAGEDADEDGLKNGDEAAKGADPLRPDTDTDGLPDGWEADNGLDPNHRPDAQEDADGDGLNNKGEYHSDTDPHNPDTDGDGLPDGWEMEHVLDPKDNGSINPDNGASGDPDGDGWTNKEEYNGGQGDADPHLPEKRTLSFHANGGLQAPGPVVLPAGGGYTVVLPGAGAMYREGYVFVNWCLNANGSGTLYSEGDAFTLSRASGAAYETSDATLYAIWDIAPRVVLQAPFIHEDGSVTLNGAVTHTLYNYDVTLEYRPAGQNGGWTRLYGEKNVGGNTSIEELLLPAAVLQPDTLYEVRLTAANVNGAARQASETQWFRIPPPPAPGNTTGDVTGEVINDTDDAITVQVFLKSGNAIVQSLVLENILFGADVTAKTREYTFRNVPDGWYSVVAYDGAYTITSNVHMEDGEMKKLPEKIIFTVGKTQSRVVTTPESPVAVTAEGLSKLFGNFGAGSLYTQDDEDTVVAVGGTVEMRLEASAIGRDDEAELDVEAAKDGLKQVLFLDLSVFKTRRDANDVLIDNTPLHDELPASLSITVPTGGRWIKKVYRIHNEAPQEWALGEVIDGESFEQPDIDTVILHMNKFSGYAMAVDTNVYTVSATAGPGGMVTPALDTHFAGDAVTVIATAAAGYVFTGWGVTPGSVTLNHPNASVASFVMPAQNITLQANFATLTSAPNAVIIARVEGAGGSITPAGDVSVPPGNSQQFTFTADTGYHVAGVKVDNSPPNTFSGSYTSTGTYTFTGVYTNRRITVRFERNEETREGGGPNTEPGEGATGAGTAAAGGAGPASPQAPQTSDDSRMGLWVVTLCASALGMAGVILRESRHRRYRRRRPWAARW